MVKDIYESAVVFPEWKSRATGWLIPDPLDPGLARGRLETRPLVGQSARKVRLSLGNLGLDIVNVSKDSYSKMMVLPDGHPGCVRYVASRAAPAPGEEDQDQQEAAPAAIATWAREELLELDDAARRLSYAVVGSNMGFGRYVATMMVVEEETEAAGCKLVWEFECEPVQGWSRDGLVGYLETTVKGMAARIVEAAAD
ncbi:hypothetical protein VPH35_013802 [Triticum aestivum]|uniref:Lachrymatory-factor synthase n=1 Tax=Aegilops tauschii TaxID=37682 RepID=M8CQ61_AEGTA